MNSPNRWWIATTFRCRLEGHGGNTSTNHRRRAPGTPRGAAPSRTRRARRIGGRGRTRPRVPPRHRSGHGLPLDVGENDSPDGRGDRPRTLSTTVRCSACSRCGGRCSWCRSEEVPIFHAAAATGIARTERKRSETLATMLGIRHPAAWIRKAEKAALAALERRGEATAQELATDVPALQRKVGSAVGKTYEGDDRRCRAECCCCSRSRARWYGDDHGELGQQSVPVGADGGAGWAGRSPRSPWPMRRPRSSGAGWRGSGRAPRRTSAGGPAGPRGRFGRRSRRSAPSKWIWTGSEATCCPTTSTRRPSRNHGSRSSLPSTRPRWDGEARDWYLGAHKNHLFDPNGNAGPTIWVNGRIAGGWAMRPNGEVVTRLLDDVGRAATRAVAAEAARLTAWTGHAPAMARFPTPLAKELLL